MESPEGFSIREYVSRMRSVNVAKCWPFDDPICEESVRSVLPPIAVEKFIWWTDCLHYADLESNFGALKTMREKVLEGKGESCSVRKSSKYRVKAPKKRSIMEIFAVAPPVETEKKKRKVMNKMKRRNKYEMENRKENESNISDGWFTRKDGMLKERKGDEDGGQRRKPSVESRKCSPSDAQPPGRVGADSTVDKEELTNKVDNSRPLHLSPLPCEAMSSQIRIKDFGTPAPRFLPLPVSFNRHLKMYNDPSAVTHFGRRPHNLSDDRANVCFSPDGTGKIWSKANPNAAINNLFGLREEAADSIPSRLDTNKYRGSANDHSFHCREDQIRTTMRLMGKEFIVGGRGFDESQVHTCRKVDPTENIFIDYRPHRIPLHGQISAITFPFMHPDLEGLVRAHAHDWKSSPAMSTQHVPLAERIKMTRRQPHHVFIDFEEASRFDNRNLANFKGSESFPATRESEVLVCDGNERGAYSHYARSGLIDEHKHIIDQSSSSSNINYMFLEPKHICKLDCSHV